MFYYGSNNSGKLDFCRDRRGGFGSVITEELLNSFRQISL